MKPILLALTILVGMTGVVRAEDAPRVHRKKVAGAAMMGVGAAGLASGLALVIHAALTPEQHLQIINGLLQPAGASSSSCCGPAKSYNTGELAGGAVLAALGLALELAGIPTYVFAGSDKSSNVALSATGNGLRLEF
jgi:hypothetical protein